LLVPLSVVTIYYIDGFIVYTAAINKINARIY